MGRPIKKGLDYFPMDVNMDDNVELFEAEMGLEGYAILVKLWKKIYSNGFYIEWGEDNSLLFARKINSGSTVVNSVVKCCLKRNLFNTELYEKYKILTSSGIQKRFFKIYNDAKRKGLLVYSEYTLINSELIGKNTEITSLFQEVSTQRKEKKSKEDNKKEKNPENLPEPIEDNQEPETRTSFEDIPIEIYSQISDDYNKTFKDFKLEINPQDWRFLDIVKLRIAEGATIEDFKTVHSQAKKDWGNKAMAKCLKFGTLYKDEHIKSMLENSNIVIPESNQNDFVTLED